MPHIRIEAFFRFFCTMKHVHLIQRRLLFIYLLLVSLQGIAQNLHISGRIGFSNYQGDLQDQSLSFKQAKLAYSLGVRYDLSEHLTARALLSYSILTAADKNNKSLALQQRNLSFQTNLWELEIGAQYNLFSLNDRWWTPYVFAGIAPFHIKPFALDNSGSKVFLQPLSTEGQGFAAGRKEYKSLQLAIPFGIGAEYALNEDMRVGLELGYRATFSDYVDDVSTTYADPAALLANRGPKSLEMAYRGTSSYPATGSLRGNAKNKDAFYFVQLTFTIRPFVDWYQRTSGLPSMKKDKRVGCPSTRLY